MNKVIGTHIGNEMGKLIMEDAPKSGLAWGPFLQIKVNIDITKPLMRGKMIQIDDLEANVDGFQFGPWLCSLVPKGNRKKDPRNSTSDIRDDEEDDTQSLVEDDEVLVQQQHLQMDPLLSVSVVNPGKPASFGTPSKDRGELAREKDLVPSSIGGLKSQMDRAAKNTEVSSNSNSNKAELSSTNKPPHISCSGLEKEARNFKIPFEKLPDIYEDIEMESSSDVAAEIPKPKTTHLLSWKQIFKDKSNLNPKDSSTSTLVPTKRLVGALDPITDPDISYK
nr:hypothetical protein CFP56_36840 [Quercus suber]